jgi:4-amino-4-deoxy-L-arabinose transferase-like glycosyltransferase
VVRDRRRERPARVLALAHRGHTRRRDRFARPGKWYAYVSFFAFVLPWTVFLIAGIAVVVRDWRTRERDERTRGMMLALLMLVVPIVIMSFFRDRKERYLLPMIVPAAVVVARAVVEHLDTRHLRNAADRVVVAAHWVSLLVIAVGLPIAGATTLTKLDGAHWYSPRNSDRSARSSARRWSSPASSCTATAAARSSRRRCS